MAGPILGALSKGYTSKQIVQFLIRKYPQHATKINAAVAMGYGPDKILKFLTGGRKAVNEPEQPQQAQQTEHEQTISTDQARRSNVNKGAAALAGTAVAAGLGGYALSRALPKVAQQVAPQLLGAAVQPAQLGYNPPQLPGPQGTPGLPGPTLPGPNSPGVQVLPTQKPASTPQQPPPQPNAPPIAQTPPQPTAPQAKQSLGDRLWEKVQAGDIKENGQKNDLLLAAKGIRKKGGLKTKEEFDRFMDLYSAAPMHYKGPAMTNYLMNQMQQHYGNEAPAEQEAAQALAPAAPEAIPNQPTGEKAVDKEAEMPEESREVAALPNGDIGEIESVKNGIAKINVNGEIKHRKLSELIKEPEEVRIALNEILQIPESERSAAMDLLHYTPKHKLLHIQFPNGKIAWYEDVDEGIVDSILEAKGTPKTSGKTATGEEWAAGIPDSRFLVVSERIIRDPKYSKANEGKTWGYSEKTYDKFKRLRTQPKAKGGPKPKVSKKAHRST